MPFHLCSIRQVTWCHSRWERVEEIEPVELWLEWSVCGLWLAHVDKQRVVLHCLFQPKWTICYLQMSNTDPLRPRTATSLLRRRWSSRASRWRWIWDMEARLGRLFWSWGRLCSISLENTRENCYFQRCWPAQMQETDEFCSKIKSQVLCLHVFFARDPCINRLMRFLICVYFSRSAYEVTLDFLCQQLLWCFCSTADDSWESLFTVCPHPDYTCLNSVTSGNK